jgi:hypothetical protein
MPSRSPAARSHAAAALLAAALLSGGGRVAAQPAPGEAVPAAPASGETRPAPPPSAVVELARVEDLYRATAFVDCVKEARRLLEPTNPEGVKRPTEVDRARTYLAACLVRSGDAAGGEREFDAGIRTALAENRAFPRPNSLVFSEEVVERYDAARRGLEAEIERRRRSALVAAEEQRAQQDRARDADRERNARLARLAAEESLVFRNRRWIAAVPFGVGQFQNRRPALGWTFLLSELAAMGVIVGGLTVELSIAGEVAQKGSQLERSSQLRAEQTWDRARSTWVIGTYSLAGLAALGIADAELRFVPEFRTVRERALPEDLRPTPGTRPRSPASTIELSPAPQGLGLGALVRF